MKLIEYINSQEPIYSFILGLLTFALIAILVRFIRFWIDIFITKRKANKLLYHKYDDEEYLKCIEIVKKYKKSLIFQLESDPDWVKPMKENIPNLVKDIAVEYYPNHPDPLFAPGISQFNHTIGLIVMDIAKYLQNNRTGRLFDRSLYNYKRYYKYYKKIKEKILRKKY